MKSSVMEEVRRIFKPEFLNRIDETIVFRALNKEDMKQIVTLMLKDVANRCKTQLNITLTVRDSVKNHIVEKHIIRNMGHDRCAEKFRMKLKMHWRNRFLTVKLRTGMMLW